MPLPRTDAYRQPNNSIQMKLSTIECKPTENGAELTRFLLVQTKWFIKIDLTAEIIE